MNAEAAEIFNKARRMGRGPRQVAAMQEAERLAAGDGDSLFHIRMALCEAAVFGGQPHVALVSFTQCLHYYDADVERHGNYLHSLLWRYKYILSRVTNFPQITKSQIDEALADFAQRVARGGFSERTARYYRWKSGFELGDPDEVKTQYTAYERLRRDSLSDCHACEINSDAEYAMFFEDWNELLEITAPIIAGKMRCAEVPHITYPLVALAHANLGRMEEAVRCSKEAMTLTASNPANFLESAGTLLKASAIAGDYSGGVRIFETYLPWILQTHDVLRRMTFYIAGAFLLSRAVKEKGGFALKISEGLIEKNALPGTGAGAMIEWMNAQSGPAAEAFDKRNGNSYWSDYRARLLGV